MGREVVTGGDESEEGELRRRIGMPNNVALVLAAVALGLLSGRGWPVDLTGAMDIDPADVRTGLPDA